MSEERGERTPIALVARLLREERGQMTILALIFFVVLIAVAGLEIDLGRLYSLEGQMHDYTDQAALTAAWQLDRTSTSLTRAICAVVGKTASACANDAVINGQQYFAAGSHHLTVQQITFFDAIGTDKGARAATPVAGDDVQCTAAAPTFTLTCTGKWTTTNAPLEARFVEIRCCYDTTANAPYETIYFLVLPIIKMFVGTNNAVYQQAIGVKATAGLNHALCNAPPIMMCNPYEAPTGGGDFTPTEGQQVHAIVQSSPITPGAIGLLNTYGTGAAALGNGLSKANPNTTCAFDNVGIDTGAKLGQYVGGLNVRMDIYGGTFPKSEGDLLPASDVAKGVADASSACSQSLTDPTKAGATIPFPRDNCFMAAPTAGAGVGCVNAQLGDGTWARDPYWNANHPGQSKPGGYSTMTRYKVYQYEQTTAPVSPATTQESGAPTCYQGGQAPDASRRVFTIAVVNCIAEQAFLKVGTPVPVVAFARVFLTEPVGWPPKNLLRPDLTSTSYPTGLYWPPSISSSTDTYAEIIDVAKANVSPQLHVYPVLYR